MKAAWDLRSGAVRKGVLSERIRVGEPPDWDNFVLSAGIADKGVTDGVAAD